MGDVVLMTPIITELNRIYPESMIDVVVRKGSESLLANNPKINRLLIWNKKENKYKNLFRTINSIRKYTYDEVITLQRHSNAGWMTLFAKTKKRIGFDKNSFSWMYTIKVHHSLTEGSHEVERNLRLIAHHGAKIRIRPELYPSDVDRKKVQELVNGPYYCIAPSSVVKSKQLPTNKWIELMSYLTTQGEVFLLGGPEDNEMCTMLAENFGEKVTVLAGKLSLLQSAALMEGAKMNFVNDSSPLHLASAMNAPVRAFFTSTIPLYGFGPLSENSKVIEPADKLTPEMTTPRGIKKAINGHYNMGFKIDVSPENLKL